MSHTDPMCWWSMKCAVWFLLSTITMTEMTLMRMIHSCCREGGGREEGGREEREREGGTEERGERREEGGREGKGWRKVAHARARVCVHVCVCVRVCMRVCVRVCNAQSCSE